MRRPTSALLILLASTQLALAASVDEQSCKNASTPATARIAACTRVVNAKPSSQAFLDRAAAYQDAFQWEAALADANRSLELDPKNREALLRRASLLAGDGETKRALGDIDRALALRVDSGTYVYRAGVLAGGGMSNEAVADYTKALALDAGNIAALLGRAQAYRDLNLDDSALADFNRAIILNGKHLQSHFERGLFFRDGLHLAEALRDFTSAIELAPNWPDAYLERAKIYALRNERDAAIADFSKALAISPDDHEALRERARVYLESGDAAKAIADDTRLLKLNRSATDYTHRGVAYLNKDEIELAKVDFQAALDLIRGPRGDVWIELARQACRMLCKARRPITLAVALLAVAPTKEDKARARAIADAEAQLGLVALKRADSTGAAKIFTDALAISKESAIALYGRGVARHRAGDAEGAEDDFAAARLQNGTVARIFELAGVAVEPAVRTAMIEAPALGPGRDMSLCKGHEMAAKPDGSPDLTSQVDACTRVIRSKPGAVTKALALVKRAAWRNMTGDAAAAFEDYAAALIADPNNVEALIAVGERFAQQRRFDQAMDAFDRAVKVEPKSILALFGRCEANAARGEYPAAVADCDGAVAAAGDDVRVKSRRAPILLRAGQHARALQDYDAALRYMQRLGMSNDPYLRFGRALALKRLGETAKAETDFRIARAQLPDIDKQYAAYGLKP